MPTTRQTEPASHRRVDADHDAQFWYPSRPDQGIGWGTKRCWCWGGTSAEGCWEAIQGPPACSVQLAPTFHPLQCVRFGRVWFSVKQHPTLWVKAPLTAHLKIWLHETLCPPGSYEPLLGQSMKRF